jgi:PAS domain S-box-containing protein
LDGHSTSGKALPPDLSPDAADQELAPLPRGAQVREPLRAGIIGGGKACMGLLRMLRGRHGVLLNLDILGVADPDPQAPGLVMAKSMGLFTTDDFTELYVLPGLDLLIELTGSQAVRERMIHTKPLAISSIDHRGARLLWDLAQSRQERLLAERALKRERDWFQVIIDALPDQLLVLDRQQTIVMVNKTFVRSSGLAESEVLGRPCGDIDVPSLAHCRPDSPHNTFQELLASRQPTSSLFSHLGRDGQEVHEEIIATPILDDRDEVFQVVMGARDITQRVHLASELRQAEEKIRLLLEAATDLICIKDLEGRYLYVNPPAAQLAGRQASEILGRTDAEIFPPALAQAITSRDAEVVKLGLTLGFVETMSNPQGARHFQTVRYPIFNDAGQMVALAVVARDVTEEKALQEKLRRSHDYMEAVLANTSDMIVTTDRQGRIVTFNPGGERMLGYSREDVLGRPITDLWQNPEQRRHLGEAVKAAGSVDNFAATLVAKDGRLVEISLSLAELRDGRGHVMGTVGVSKDVTEENRLRAQLIENERLAAIGETVAGMAHCIKNILNGLKGGSYMVSTGLEQDKPERVRSGWTSVQKAIARIGDLSQDMLNYCRERTPQSRPIDPGEVARAAVEMLSQSARLEGLEMTVRAESGPPVWLDPDAMNRALMNLLTNALDACRSREYPPGVKASVMLEVQRPPGEVRFLVADNGEGMDDKVRSQLFQRFFSTKDYRGTGLGLPVVQKIVAEHGGRVEVESRLGQGTTFTLIIPQGCPEGEGPRSNTGCRSAG